MPSVWSATGMVISALTRVLRSRLHVSGLEKLKYGGPILFVANHFTRFETCLIPYLVYTETGRVARSLADGGLFVGGLGSFLRRVNVFPNDDPGYKTAIMSDLVSGAHDWVIFPEGMMVKTKRVRDTAGELWLSSPHRDGPPHTGAAVFALQAEIRRTALRGRLGGLAATWARKQFAEPLSAAAQPVRIVPVTFTYFPMRPGDNAIHATARWLVGELPPQVQEELQVEGNLLLGDCHIDVHFGRPLVLEPEVEQAWRRMRCAEDPCSPERIESAVLGLRRHRLTSQAMDGIYSRALINPDHLLVCTLRRSGREVLDRRHLVLASYLAARALTRHGGFRLHPETMRSLEKELTIGPAPAVDDLLELGVRSNVLTLEGDDIRVDREALATQHGFHGQRLCNPLAVIANELRGNPAAVRVVRRYAAQPTQRLATHLAMSLLREAEFDYERDYQRLYDRELSRPIDVGRPVLLPHPSARYAVVLSHGYLAAPREVAELGRHLRDEGFTVYLPRLPGHGTAPVNLLEVGWRHWLASYRRALTALDLMHDGVIAAGFSTGGLLALCAASESTARLGGVVSINGPTRLVDRRARMVPLVRKWGAAMTAFGRVPDPQWVANDTESPDINYTRNYLHGVAELMDLMTHTQTRLPKVTVPTLLIQGDHDPVVDPRSARDIHESLGTTNTQLVSLARDRHVIVRGKGAARLHQQVATFCHGAIAELEGEGRVRSA